jgi:hypothetical protein
LYPWLLAQLRALPGGGSPPFPSMAAAGPGRWVFTLPALWEYCSGAGRAAGIVDVPEDYPAFRQWLFSSTLNRDMQPAGHIAIYAGSGKVDTALYVLA